MSENGAAQNGNGDANDLMRQLYDQLRRAAAFAMTQERRDHTLTPTALVNEAYIRLVEAKPVGWDSKAHFYGAAAKAMRQILIDHARTRGRLKRGGDGQGRGARKVPIDLMEFAYESDADTIMALEEAICRMEASEPEVARVVILRFFTGLTVDQTAEAVGSSPRQVDRDWQYARAKLVRELGWD